MTHSIWFWIVILILFLGVLPVLWETGDEDETEWRDEL